MPLRPLSRRTLLRGAGISLALPFLEAMQPTRAHAQATTTHRFFAFFYPCGVETSKWMPAAGPLTAAGLPECLQDLTGFAAEGIWPAEAASFADIAVVNGIDHS